MKYTDYKKWRIEEVRAVNVASRPLASKYDVRNYPRWAYYGWDGSSTLFCFSGNMIIEVKFIGIPTVFRFEFSNEWLNDKGSVPDVIPDAIADDCGWLWQLMGYHIHDNGYTTNLYSRLFYDCLLREFVRISSGDVDANIIYYPVRLFGWTKWEKPEWVQRQARAMMPTSENDKFFIVPRSGSDVLSWRHEDARV